MQTLIQQEMEGLIIVAVILAVGIATIPISMYVSVRKIAASPDLTQRDDLVPEITSALPPDLAAFLNSIGFKFSAAYSFHASRIWIWQQQGAAAPRRLFSFSRTGPVRNMEFITELADDYSLTTTITRAAFVFPRRYGSFIQSFPKASIQQLWDQHTRGEEYLTADLSVPLKECALSFAAGFPVGVLRQMACVKSIPFWAIRGIYWFLVKRFLMQNRPIWTQNLTSLYVKMQ